MVDVGCRNAGYGGLLELRLQGQSRRYRRHLRRNTFLIMPKALATGDIAGLAKSDIFAFDAEDNNSGFMTTMKFARDAYPDQKIVLTEKSSKKISEQKGHVGSREKTTATFSKTYHYERLGWTDNPKADIVMKCIEYQLTAP
jgi:hypothetical protein